MNDVDELVDPEQFVETGFKLVTCSATMEQGYRKRCVSVSPLSNLIIESRDEMDYFVYRRFSTNDIEDTKAFTENEKHIIKTSTIWASFFDFELLKMIEEDSTPLNRILDKFNSELSDSSSLDGNESSAAKRVRVQIRRINFWLQRKMLVYDEVNGKLTTTSLLEKTINEPSYRDILLKIGQLCPDFSLISTFDNQGSMQELTENMTLQVIDSLSASFVQTGALKEISMIEWPTNM